MTHRPIARALCLPTLACKEQAELLSLHHHPPRTTHRKRVTTIAVSPADLRFVAALALHFWQFWPGGCHILRAWKSEPVVVLTIRRKERLRLQCKINCIKHWLHWISFPAHSSQHHATKPLFKNFGVRLFEVIWRYLCLCNLPSSPNGPVPSSYSWILSVAYLSSDLALASIPDNCLPRSWEWNQKSSHLPMTAKMW